MTNRAYFNAFHQSQEYLYKNCDCEKCKAQQYQFSASNKKAFNQLLNVAEKAFKRLHKNGDYSPTELFEIEEYNDLIEATSNIFNSTITHSTSGTLRDYLERDGFVFSGLKTHAQLTEARSYLQDENGIVPYHQFEQKILKLNKQYNKNYLEAEYEFAVQSAMSADSWENLQESNRYILQYRTASDDKVRASHQPLHNVTLPKQDAFWQSYYPPNGWRCRCLVIEVLAKNTQISDSDKAQKLGKIATTQIGKNGKNRLKMFRFNPGADKKLFPPNNNYNPKHCTNGRLSFAITSASLSIEDEKCKAKQIIEEKAFKEHLKTQRKEIRDWAREHLIGKTVRHNAIQNPIGFTMKAVKEAINQPHKHIIEKNEVVRDILNILPNADYKGKTLFKNRISHIFEITIKDEYSYIIANEYEGRPILFYSITDSNKVLSDIKKPK